MDKQKKMQIALPILFIVMAFVWGPVITGGGSKRKNESKVNPSGISTSLQGSSADLVVLARSNERKQARTSHVDWGRNPFMLSESPKASILEGIMWDAQDPKAIINGNIIGVGDRVGSGEVVDIQQNSVTIRNGTIEKEYRLGQ